MDKIQRQILIVDDDEDIKQILKKGLEKNGYTVVLASEGEEALNLIRRQVINLMIVDLTMPVMNGWQFTFKVRQEPRYKATPIIVLSGLVDREAQPEMFEAATFYMPKPFDVFKLLKKIKELLEQVS